MPAVQSLRRKAMVSCPLLRSDRANFSQSAGILGEFLAIDRTDRLVDRTYWQIQNQFNTNGNL